jgi:hypothetical protein
MAHEPERLAALTMEDDIPVHSALHVGGDDAPSKAKMLYKSLHGDPATAQHPGLT